MSKNTFNTDKANTDIDTIASALLESSNQNELIDNIKVDPASIILFELDTPEAYEKAVQVVHDLVKNDEDFQMRDYSILFKMPDYYKRYFLLFTTVDNDDSQVEAVKLACSGLIDQISETIKSKGFSLKHRITSNIESDMIEMRDLCAPLLVS